jgi:hypothetical protein
MAWWSGLTSRPNLRGWGLVLITGIVLTVLALIDVPSDGAAGPAHPADGSTGCQLRVTVAELRVRSGPSTDSDQVGILSEGVVVDGTRVVQNGFRQLEGNRWAADQYLSPLPNTTCA